MNHGWDESTTQEHEGRGERERFGTKGVERDPDVERRDANVRAERLRSINQSPWAIGSDWYDQRDLYTKGPETDASGYGRGPSVHPEEGSYAYPRKTHPNEQPVLGGDASLYEKEAWPWLVYKEMSADPYFAHLHERPSRASRSWSSFRSMLAAIFGRRLDAERRSDARIRDDVSTALWMRRDLDTSEVEMKVERAEITLEGVVVDRHTKDEIANVVRGVRGVRVVHNHLRVHRDEGGGFVLAPAT